MRFRDVTLGMCVSAPAIVGQGKRIVGGVTHKTGSDSRNYLLTIATDTGVVHQPPEDCEPYDGDSAWLIQTRRLSRGLIVVLFNGKVRKVARVLPLNTSPPTLCVDYFPVEGDETFRGNSAAPDSLWRLLSTAEENQ